MEMHDNSIKIFAKINFSLNILGKLENGYHSLDTILVSVPELYDIITITHRDDSSISIKTIPSDIFPISHIPQLELLNSNIKIHTAYKMAEILRSKYNLGGMDIVVQKGIPMRGGLGGSAAAAAGVLELVNVLYDLNLDASTKTALARNIGEDVPFMCTGGCARQIDADRSLNFFLPKVPIHHLIIISDSEGLSTKEVFEGFKSMGENGVLVDNTEFVKKLTTVDADYTTKANNDIMFAKVSESLSHKDHDLYTLVSNSLVSTASTLDSGINASLNKLRATGANVVSMTGTGSACFGIYEKNTRIDEIFKNLKDSCKYAYLCSIF